MLYQVYAPDMPSSATIADYIASAAIFGLLLSVATAGVLSGNIVACERADGSAVFLACQPVSRWKIVLSKAIVVFGAIAATWLLHAAMQYGLARGFSQDPRPYVRIEGPVLFASSAMIVSAGIAWLTSVLARSPSMAISAGLAAAIAVPWLVYLSSLFITVAPDDLNLFCRITQWVVGLGGLIGGTAIYVKRVEP
jgi:ABC-type transport system involved in multi-copper enzyme maturation permease subunit